MYAPEHKPATSPANNRTPKQPKHPVVPDNRELSLDAAQKSVALADQLKNEGKLQEAAFEYRRAAELGKNIPEIKDHALSELNFYIPVILAQQQALAGKHANAKKILEAAAARNRQHPDRIQNLTNMLNSITLISNTEQTDSALDGKSVLRSVTRILKQYQREAGHYPLNRAELTQTLPPNKFPLIHFSIRNYRGSTSGFSLVLQSNSNPENRIRAHQTGLMQ